MKLKNTPFIAASILVTTFSVSAITPFSGGTGDGSMNSKSGYYEFRDDKYVWYVDGILQAEGRYTTEGKYLIVTDTKGPRACLSKNEDIEVGIYSWETYENKMYLTVIHDDCGGRQRGFLQASPLSSEQ